MTLGLTTTSASQDFLPIAIIDARAGRIFKVERAQQSDGSWESSRIDITTPPPVFAFDMPSIQVGWITFAATGPDFQLVPIGQPLPPQPNKDYKQGFRVRIQGKVLDGVREFSHTAKCVLSAVDDLHTRYEAAPEAAAGKIPVVRLSSFVPVITKGPAGNSTNYSPVFDIVGWTDRTPEMGERTVPAPGAKTNGHDAAPPAAPPPAASAMPEPPAHITEPTGMPDEW